jgi:pimeloyl-ACP methyl ester carboxylesterase
VQIARIDNAGHMLQHDQPEQLAQLLENFLST